MLLVGEQRSSVSVRCEVWRGDVEPEPVGEVGTFFAQPMSSGCDLVCSADGLRVVVRVAVLREPTADPRFVPLTVTLDSGATLELTATVSAEP